jgi:hypothetical protein
MLGQYEFYSSEAIELAQYPEVQKKKKKKKNTIRDCG